MNFIAKVRQLSPANLGEFFQLTQQSAAICLLIAKEIMDKNPEQGQALRELVVKEAPTVSLAAIVSASKCRKRNHPFVSGDSVEEIQKIASEMPEFELASIAEYMVDMIFKNPCTECMASATPNEREQLIAISIQSLSWPEAKAASKKASENLAEFTKQELASVIFGTPSDYEGQNPAEPETERALRQAKAEAEIAGAKAAMAEARAVAAKQEAMKAEEELTKALAASRKQQDDPGAHVETPDLAKITDKIVADIISHLKSSLPKRGKS